LKSITVIMISCSWK